MLGLLAFAGLLGFAGIWQVFVVCTYFLAREHRLSNLPVARAASLAAIVGFVVVVLQMWGDMGLVTLPVEVLAATCMAAAARLPVLGDEYEASQAWRDDEDQHDVDDAEEAEGKQRAT